MALVQVKIFPSNLNRKQFEYALCRAHDKILRVGRTIADLDESESIEAHHLSEAINYRALDRSHWSVS